MCVWGGGGGGSDRSDLLVDDGDGKIGVGGIVLMWTPAQGVVSTAIRLSMKKN